jgi:hypothetical protein
MPYRVTWRPGGRVEKLAATTLEDALAALEQRARTAAAGPGLKTVDLRARRYEPGDQIAARGELRGPERWRPSVRGGLDVRGDGSVRAWTGAPTRAVVEPIDGEDAYAALRRALTA